jgi:hypothetical protein
MEASTISNPLYQSLKQRAFQAGKAHSSKLRLIAEGSKKNDRNDIFHLANMLRDELPA